MNDLGLHAWHVPLRLGWAPDRIFGVLQDIVTERPAPNGGRERCDTWDNAVLHGWVTTDSYSFPLTTEMKRIDPGEKNTWEFEALGLDGGVRFSTKNPKRVKIFSLVDVPGGGREQVWSSLDAGSQSVWPTVTGPNFESGFSDAILQMLAAFLAEREGALGDRFGCATPDEAALTHAIYGPRSDRTKRARSYGWADDGHALGTRGRAPLHRHHPRAHRCSRTGAGPALRDWLGTAHPRRMRREYRTRSRGGRGANPRLLEGRQRPAWRDRRRLLAEHGVDLEDVTTTAGAATSYTIVLQPPDHDRTFWHHPGANAVFTGREVNLDGVDILHLGYPPLLPALLVDDAAPLLDLLKEARNRQITTSLDLAVVDPRSRAAEVDWRRVFARIMPYVDIATPSIDDLTSALAIARTPDDDLVEECARRLVDDGCAVAVVSAGARGAYAVSAGADRLAAGGGSARVSPVYLELDGGVGTGS